jgi:hypothetical protein
MNSPAGISVSFMPIEFVICFVFGCSAILGLERVLQAVAEQPMAAGGNFFASLRNGSK